MLLPEAAFAGPAKILAQIGDAQNLAYLLLSRLGSLAPDHRQNIAHAAHDIIGMIRVVYHDTIPFDIQGIAIWRYPQWQTILACKHARRANGQRCEWIG